MKAILVNKGQALHIYVLIDDKGKCEVMDFLDRKVKDRPLPGHITGFWKIIHKLAMHGTDILPVEMFKCWNEEWKDHNKKNNKDSKCEFCELRKDKWRISAFRYGKKLLLITYFRKTRMVERLQYQRAIKLNKLFNNNPIWSTKDE